MSHWPAFRTPKRATPGWRAFLGATLITLFVPVLAGIALASLSSILFGGPETDSPLGSLLFSVGFFMSVSIYFSWVGLLLALPFVFLAFRTGYAGWAVALALGLLTGAVIYAAFGMIWTVTIPLGMTFAALCWLSLRWFSPASFTTKG